MIARDMYMSPADAARVLGLGDEEHEYRFRKEDVKHAFRVKASAVHPDHGGEEWQMRALLEARDVLLLRRSEKQKPARTRRKAGLETAFAQEMQEFARRASTKRTTVDLADAWLALPRIRKWGLDLDDPRAAKLARAEVNRGKRSEWSGGIGLEQAEDLAAMTHSVSLSRDSADLADRCADKVRDETYAPGQIDEGDPDAIRERQIQKLLKYKGAVKLRDREILELLFEDDLTIKEVAARTGKGVGAIYEALKRMRTQGLLADEKARREWADEHCALEKFGGDAAPLPVILLKNQQLAWDLGVLA